MVLLRAHALGIAKNPGVGGCLPVSGVHRGGRRTSEGSSELTEPAISPQESVFSGTYLVCETGWLEIRNLAGSQD